jgi:glutamate synthase (NADPH) large chain
MHKLIAVGQVFLPRTDFGAQERCRTIVETEVLRWALHLWLAPCAGEHSVLGDKANATRPEIEQILIRCDQGHRRRAVRARAVHHPPPDREGARAAQIQGLYLCSLSCRSIIYKGMMLAEQVGGLLPRPDGRAVRERLRDLSPALFHQHLPAMVAGPALPHAGP